MSALDVSIPRTVQKGESIVLQRVLPLEVIRIAINTNLDIASYESCDYQPDYIETHMIDLQKIYEAYLKSRKGSKWKEQVQKFELQLLVNLISIQKDLESMTYELSPATTFTLSERGHTRFVVSSNIRDRVATHYMCDEIINPIVSKYLIYDNAASQKGKGIDFARNRLKTHLHKFYRQYGTNHGYILIMDFSKYYDNIRHDVLMERYRKYISDPICLHYIELLLQNQEIDVSYMTREEYETCMDAIFNSLEYQFIPDELKTGERFMKKHLEIGDQLSQTSALVYPIPFDNYIKIVKGLKFYARYMDDSYIIHHDKKYLEALIPELIEQASKLGITLNRKKTHIYRLDDWWRYLQIRYCLTDTGKVYTQINPIRLTAFRRKLKKVSHTMEPEDFENFYKSWTGSHSRYMSEIQRQTTESIFREQMEVCLQCALLRCLPDESSKTSSSTATTTSPLSSSQAPTLRVLSPKWSFSMGMSGKSILI